MAKYRPIYTKIWRDPDFQDYTPEQKIIFIYLCTSDSVTESGIYPISFTSIANDTGVEKELVKSCLEENKLKNVLYDCENRYVFVRNIRRYHTGGRPELLKRSIANDYKLMRSTWLWFEFVKQYPEFNDIITNHFLTVEQPLANVEQPLANVKKQISTNLNLNLNPNLNLNLITTTGSAEKNGDNISSFAEIYEQNIGLITPMIAEELANLARDSPVEWFVEAVKEACLQNKRNISYVKAILERWKTEGFKVDTRKKEHAGKSRARQLPSAEEIERSLKD